jgi:hypothetical protein
MQPLLKVLPVLLSPLFETGMSEILKCTNSGFRIQTAAVFDLRTRPLNHNAPP